MPAAPNLHIGHDGAPVPDGYYVRRGASRFASTLHVEGAWQPGEQHLAPAAGLVLAAVEQQLPSDKLVSRASFDVLGVIYSGEFDVDVRVVRPGRTIELIEASMRHGERVSIRARIWRLQRSDTAAVAGIEWPALPARATMHELKISKVWAGGYIASLEAHQSAETRPGRGQTWLRSRYPLIAGEADPPVAHFAKLIDTANGLVVREDPRKTFFANVDLTVHFMRQPMGDWVGFDTRQNFGPTGLGETFSVLSDEAGPVGTAVQSLTVRMGHGAQH